MSDIMVILTPALVLGGLGFLLGLAIFVVGKYFTVEEDHAIEEVEHLLPNYNCGACGFPGCHGMAIALVEGKTEPAQCKPIKKEEIEVLKKYLDELKKKKSAA